MINRYDMRIKTNYKKCIRTVCIALFSLAFTGCTKDDLNEFGPGNATGKVVMVSLNVSLPPIEETTPTGRYPTVKPFFKNENNSDSSFTVVLEQEQRTRPEYPMAQQSCTISGFSSSMRMVPLMEIPIS